MIVEINDQYSHTVKLYHEWLYFKKREEYTDTFLKYFKERIKNNICEFSEDKEWFVMNRKGSTFWYQLDCNGNLIHRTDNWAKIRTISKGLFA